MSADQSSRFNFDNVDSRLTQWRQNLQDNIESSTRKAIDNHVESVSTVRFTDTQKLEFEMNKIMETAVQKVEDMKKYEMDTDKIREAILPAIHNMNSPYPAGSDLHARFNDLNKQIYDRVDAEIVGQDVVNRRNMRF